MESNVAFQPLQQETKTDTVNSNKPTTSASTGNHHNNTGTHTVERPSPILYRTKCDPNTIPFAARNMTWTDSFYERISYRTDDIIAVFDIDRTVYDYKEVIALVLVASFVFCIVFFMFSLWAILIFIFEIDRQSNKFRLQRTHIAITHNGICIDEVDAPGSTNLVCRTFIKFSDIKQCKSISEYSLTEGSMTHKIHLTMQQPRTERFIVGVKQQQTFVDIVNEMMVNTPPSAAETKSAQTTSNKTSVEVGTNKDVIAVAEVV